MFLNLCFFFGLLVRSWFDVYCFRKFSVGYFVFGGLLVWCFVVVVTIDFVKWDLSVFKFVLLNGYFRNFLVLSLVVSDWLSGVY